MRARTFWRRSPVASGSATSVMADGAHLLLELLHLHAPARGGAGFPAGRKWSMLRKAPTTYLVINGDESEPATFKDHLLIERDPHQIIEGVIIAAYAIRATQAFIYVRGEFALGIERMQQALNDAYSHGAVGRNILGSEFSVDVVLHPGAGAYICGEETALLESLEGKRGFPRIKPPYFPAAIGLCLTLIHLISIPVTNTSVNPARSTGPARPGPARRASSPKTWTKSSTHTSSAAHR